MHSKVSSDWLPSYVKAMCTVLEIFKMDGYFVESPLFLNTTWVKAEPCYNITMKG